LFLVLFQDDSQDAAVKITYAGANAVPPTSTGLVLPSESDWDPYRKDMYSVGMITYQLLSGGKEPPTDLDTHLVVPGSSLFLGRRWKLIRVSKNAKHFVEQCFHWNAEPAFTVEQARQHPWMTQEHVHRSDTSRAAEPKKDIVVVRWQDATRPASEVTPVVSLSREQYVREVQSRNMARDEDGGEEKSSTAAPPEVEEEIPVFFPAPPELAVEEAVVEEANDSVPDAHLAMREKTIPESESDPSLGAATLIAPRGPIPVREETIDQSTTPVDSTAASIPEEEAAPVLETTDQSTTVDPIPASIPEEEATPEEFMDLRHAFDEAAADCGGGDVNVDVLKAKLKTKYTEEEVNTWFQSEGKYIDASVLDYHAVLRKAIQNRRTIEVQRVDAAFKKIDKGRRGFVTVGNLRAVLGTDNSENIELLLKAADTKRDGSITYDNFERVVQNMLAANEKDK
jgi:Ca2+-binding EF-hand superfamily protein